jgi:hypothetical protein
MEAATPLRIPHVHVFGDRLVVDGLQVDDPVAVRVAREREEAGESASRVVTEAIEIGARVLDREQTAVQTDFVKAEFERQAREVETVFTDKARIVAEHFGRKVDEVFAEESGSLNKALVRHFGDESNEAVQHRVRALVDQVMREAQQNMLKQFSASDGSNPLADFKQAAVQQLRAGADSQERNLRLLHEQMGELRSELQTLRAEKEKLEEVAAEREKGTAKGRSFEEAVAAALDEIAEGQGDVCDAVGDFIGAGGKKGDVVVELDACAGPSRGRIVFEVKDKRLSKPKAIEELDIALSQRGADYAVLVVRTDDEVPAKLQALREFNGDKLVVAYDPEEGSRLGLEVAYKLARARVLMAKAGDEGLDTAALRDRVERALGALDEARNAKRELTNAATAIERVRGSVETLEERVRTQLGEIDAALAGVEDAASADE